MKFYRSLFLINLKAQMQYKLSLFMTSFGQFLTAFATYFSLDFVLRQVNAVDRFTYGQTALCFAVIMVAFSLGEAVGGGLAVFPRMVNQGEFDRILTRPRNPVLQIIVPNFDFTRVGLFLQGLLVLALAIPVSGIVWTPLRVLTLVLMLLCGSVLFFCLFLFKASFCFFTMNSLDFLNIFTYGARQFGRYPFSVYGKTILYLLTFVIPLALVQYWPLLYLIGEKTGPLYVLTPLLSLLFILPCWALFRFGIRHYKSAGS